MTAKIYHRYECRTGCGHVTITDNLNIEEFKYCSNCADEDMELKGACYVTGNDISIAGLPIRLEGEVDV